MIYDMRVVKISENLFDLYINEKHYRNINGDELFELIFDHDQDFQEPVRLAPEA